MSSATPALPTSLFTNGSLSSPQNISKTELNNCVKVSDPSGFKWRLVIAYDGTKFAGCQYQESPPTIQSMLEKALTQITKLERKQLHLVGAGRTSGGGSKRGSLLQLEVEGSGFMYRQVRNMVALLVQGGKEALDSDIVPMILETKDRRELAKYTLPAPPHGLSLVSAKYNEDHLQFPPDCLLTSFGRHHTITKCNPFY